ncbi:MAG: hypothetical protein IPG52_12900 [Rhodocyclaceae bacterium]|nr:hypothetical protein [Rhodocyclaceae bacterium]
MRVAVLTYHSQNITGNDYINNDHVAFHQDIEHVLKAKIDVVSLRQIADTLLGRATLPSRAVAFSCDDGTDLDFRDIHWPHHGLQQSFATIIREVAAKTPRSRLNPITSFVIADPAARRELDNRCLSGLGWMSEDWWQPAVDSELFHIGIHGWDHCHPMLERYSTMGSACSTGPGISDYQSAKNRYYRQCRISAHACPIRVLLSSHSLLASFQNTLSGNIYPTFKPNISLPLLFPLNQRSSIGNRTDGRCPAMFLVITGKVRRTSRLCLEV